MIDNLLIFIISCAILILSGAVLVRSLIRLGSFLGISGFILSFIVMAFSTSIPELLVGIRSSMVGEPLLALGNVIGSNVANVTLVAGATALLAKGFKTSPLIRQDAYSMVFLVVLATGLTYIGGQLSRADGIILLIALAVYFYFLILKRNGEKQFPNKHTKWQIISAAYLFPLSVILLFFSSEYVVESGIALASDLALPVLFVGLFFVALGTSLPELAFETQAALKGRDDIAMGDLIGSVVMNTTLVLAVVALIQPFSAGSLFYISSAFMITACLLFAIMCESFDEITWREGVALIMLYILFIMVEFTIKGMLNGVPTVAV